jgi:putative transcription factor
MRCEVCGREILGQPQRRIIEGAKLTVCPRCASFGTQEWSNNKPTPKDTERSNVPLRTDRNVSTRPPRRDDVESLEQTSFVENYGVLIRKSRQKLGLTEKDLAMKMQEKESVVKKLEKEEFTPDIKLIQKIKQILGVNIIEKAEASKVQILTKPINARTLGDLIKIEPDKEAEDK